MSDWSPVAAREHVGAVGRGSAVRFDPEGESGAASLFAADDAARTRPVPIVAPRRLGETELTTYPFALGTARLAAVDEVTAERILLRFGVRGGTMFDVCDEDGSGRSQELLGAWLSRSRANALLALTPLRARGVGGQPRDPVAATDAALARLGVDHVELLVLDLSGSALDLEQHLSAADRLIAAGKARYLAVRGASGDQLLQARVLAGNGLPRVVAVRPEWDMTDKASCGEEMRMVAAAQELAVLPDATAASLALLSPSLPQKVLVGWGRAAKLGQAVNARIAGGDHERAVDALSGRGRAHRIALAIDKVSDELGVAPATTQLAWLLAKRGVVAPIVQATRPEQVDLLMDAAAVRLTRAQMLELDRAVELAR
jgi:aryl-alcohol dehydrogenase-like predicted oxidoreductase